MKPKRRGIVLISILVLTLLATFFLGALVQMNPDRLRRTVHDERRDRAAQAAHAGVDYALNQLKSDFGWKADANLETVVMDDFVVREDNGNVLGWIRTENGPWAGFRLRFNHQDGTGGGDGLEDPTYEFHSQEVSLNNLTGSSAKPLPMGDGSGYSVSSYNAGVQVPAGSVALVVEGIVSNGLDPSNPATLAESQSVTSRTLEGIYTVSEVKSGTSNGDLGQMQEANLTVGDKLLAIRSSEDNQARLRAKGELNLQRKEGSSGAFFAPDDNAQVLTGETNTFSQTTVDGDSFTGGVEQADDPFLEIPWLQASNSNHTPIPIPAGVYVFTEGNIDSGRTIANNVQYYEMTWDEYEGRMSGEIPGGLPAPEPADTALASRIQLDQDVMVNGTPEKRDIITFEQDMEVVASGGVEDLVIAPLRGARQKAPTGSGAPSLPSHSGDLDNNGVPDGIDNAAITVDHIMAGIGSTSPGNAVIWLPGNSTPILYANGSFANGLSDATAILAQMTSGGSITVNQNYDPGQAVGWDERPGTEPYQLSSDPAGLTIVPFPSDITPLLEDLPGAPLDQAAEDDPTFIEKDANGDEIPDGTVPQDIEIVFEPGSDVDSAFLRSDGNIFLGTHLSGEGGGILSQKKLDLIGFGIDLEALADGNERDGLAFYGAEGINISTYDLEKNLFWDVNIAGVIYSKNGIVARLGQELFDVSTSPVGENPPWGFWNFRGSLIARNGGWTSQAEGFDNFYDPSFLAPFLEEEEVNPTFAPVSVVVR